MAMLSEICAEVRNYFVREIRHGTFTIADGALEPVDFLLPGQYYRIVGSVFNDGVYQYAVEEQAASLTDETFTGAVWAMGPPPAFIALTAEIESWTQSDAAKPSPYTSESFGGYAYTRATNTKGMAVTWKDVFADRLNKYRRISVL